MNLENVQSAPVIEEICDVLCNKTQNTDRGFFKVEIAYFLGKLAASMRASIQTKDRGEVPVNIYALNLATSGYGKGHSISLMENKFIAGFKRRFLEETMPQVSSQHMDLMAQDRAIRNNTDEATERDALEAEYKKLGSYPFTFDSGTTPAVKQLREKLIMADCGAINLQIDEIGSNLIGATDVLNTFLELYDQGQVKQKLIKNTVDNTRGEDRDGKTPTNMLLFGSPVKLFDGGSTEDEFYSFLEIGYARRCLFGIGKQSQKASYSMTPAEIFAKLTSPTNDAIIHKWSSIFTRLADPAKYNWKMDIADATSIKLIEYKCECEKLADSLAEHEGIKKAEIAHRYFKALKLAGALAFVDESLEVTMEHLMQAIKLVEESGQAFSAILTREKTYMKLAKYIAQCDTEVTHADLTEALPFYKSGIAARNEMMSLAMGWGYKNHIIIKKSFVDGIEFFKGESLKETNLNEIIISYSDESQVSNPSECFAFNYGNEKAPWNQFDKLVLTPGIHWCNHWFTGGHRCNECALTRFNLVVLDVDHGIKLTSVQDLLKEYEYLIYTTKRHQVEGEDRFRVLLPLNYELDLMPEEYKEFMNNILKWLPFEVDESVNQPAKKWLSNPGQIFRNQGKLLDALPFIPKTSRNETFKKEAQKVENLDALERWFAGLMVNGNRNNLMIRYALILVDNGMSFDEICAKVKKFNKQLSNGLPEEEIENTILVTVAKRCNQ